MTAPKILLLHLGSPLLYRRSSKADPRAAGPGEADLLLVYPADAFPPSPGPAAAPAPSPLFSGTAQHKAEEGGDACYQLEAGDYWFAQWEPESSEPQPGLGAFAAALANEGKKAEGLWLLRILREEGGVRCQGLRKRGA